MLLRNRSDRTLLLCLIILMLTPVPLHARAQDDSALAPEKHGRKYKSPPDTSHVEVTVLKDFNKKPIMNAAVIFRPTKDGIDEGNLELKTDPQGKAAIDVIPTGSKVTIQVIADGFSTFAGDYQVNEASKAIVISMIRPRAQVSTYIDNSGKPADLKPGVQDPVRPKSSSKTTTPASTTIPANTSPATVPSSGTATKP